MGIGLPMACGSAMFGIWGYCGFFGNTADRVITAVAPVLSDIAISNDIAFLTKVNNDDEDVLYPDCCNTVRCG